MAGSELTQCPEEHLREGVVTRRRATGNRLRLGALSTLLLVSATLFIAVVCWQRDLVHIKRATEAADRTREWIERYLASRDHLPFALPAELERELGPLEIAYPARDDIYILTGISGPYLLVAGMRQGLLPPREAGCAAIIYDHGTLSTEWLNMDQIETHRERRDELLGRSHVQLDAASN